MCGIAGCALSNDASPERAREDTRRMIERMHLRGPDAEGLWAGDGVVLGHRRLAILDLAPRANQPMRSHDARYSIVFNGEIYNFRELRNTLERQGIPFHTTSDTEVLLALYEKEGPAMLKRLRGMFALAIWDSCTHELFLARDPYGIKPLYYTQTRHGLLFASQVKALLASGIVPDASEPAGLAGFFLWGSVPEPWTLYRDVFALPAGYWLRVRDGIAGTPTCWHDIRVHWQGDAPRADKEDLAAIVRGALRDSVLAHLVSDVPISVFLSGGVDSTVVAALAHENGAEVHGVTVGFAEFAGQAEDEVPRAAAAAAHYGLRHTKRVVSRAEFARDTPRILAAMDQPSIDGVNTWFASKAAAEQGYKVVLSGIGGDELFCGYSSFARIPRTAMLGRVAEANVVTRMLIGGSFRYLGTRWRHPKMAALPALSQSLESTYFLHRCLFLPNELPALMEPEMALEGLARLGPSAGLNPVGARNHSASIGFLESTCYLRNQLLRDSDWASMDHSLELRTPLVDTQLLAELAPFVSSFTRGAGKALMSQALRAPLPAAITSRPKTGFGVPMARWLSHPNDDGPDRPRDGKLHGKSWARHWATIVMADAISCA